MCIRDRNGTPLVKFKRKWDREKQILKIQASHINSNKKNLYNNLPLIIPIDIAIFLSSNEKIIKTIILISDSISEKVGILSISDKRDKFIFLLFLIIDLNVVINLFSILIGIIRGELL